MILFTVIPARRSSGSGVISIFEIWYYFSNFLQDFVIIIASLFVIILFCILRI